MTSSEDQQAFMSALVTEHFVLQSAASTTVSEASGRASLYLTALSSSLIAMGFATQAPGLFAPFAAIVIPTIVIMGVFTTVRLVDTGVQNLRYLAGIAHIRGYYRTLKPGAESYFTPWGTTPGDEIGEGLANLAVRRGPLVGFGTTASMIAAINSILFGTGVALALVWATGKGGTVAAVLLGLVAVIAGLSVFYRYQNHRYQALDANVGAGGGFPTNQG